MKRIHFLPLLLLFLSACAGTKPDRYIQKDTAVFNVRVERGACFGSCPVYNADITSDGKMVYEPIRFVEGVGTMVVADLMPVEMDSLKSFLTQDGFFGLDSLYDNPQISDLPTTEITVSWGEGLINKKTVVGRYDVPESFKALAAYLERLRKRHF